MITSTEGLTRVPCSLRGVKLNYGSGDVLKGIDLTLPASKIIALLGLNGAGKSTLMEILAGYLQPTQGNIVRSGTVAMVHQELSLLPDLSIAENLALPRLSSFRKRGFLRWDVINEQGAQALRTVGLQGLSPSCLVGELSTGEQQLIEIARALLLHPSLLILDEPTSALSRQECLKLFSILKTLANHGTTIIFVSHRLDEVREFADEVVVLRDGLIKAHFQDDAWRQNEDLVALMTGETQAARVQAALQEPTPPKQNKTSAHVVSLKIQDFRVKEHPSGRMRLHWPSLYELPPGRIVGLAGLLGSGRSLILQALAATLKPAHGGRAVPLDGLHVSGTCQGSTMAYLHEDRKTAGLFLELSALENIAVSESSYTRFSRAQALWPRLSVKGGASDKAKSLSGGNQQKLLLGRAFLSGANLLLLDEPTRGVDGHSRLEIYKLMKAFAANGGSILWTSSDFYELYENSHELLHVCNGQVAPFSGPVNSGQDVTTLVLNHSLRG